MYLKEAGLQLLYHGVETAFLAAFSAPSSVFESNIVFLDEEEDVGKATLALVAAQQILLCRLHSKEQELLQRDISGAVTFMVTVRKREGLMYVLATQVKDSTPEVLFFSGAKKPAKLLHTHLPRNSYIKQLRLPKETTTSRNVCITLSGAPHVVSVWRVDKQKLLVEKSLKVTNPVFDQSVENPLQLVVGGNRYLRLWEVNSQEGTLEEAAVHLVPLKFERESDFLDVRYVPNTSLLLCLVSNNRLILFDNYEQIRILPDLMVPKEGLALNPQEPIKAERLILTPHGFCVAGSSGCIALYNIDEAKAITHSVTTQISPSVVHIWSGSVSTDGNFVVLTCQQRVEMLEMAETPANETEALKIKLDFYIVNLKKLENELPDPVFMLFPASQPLGSVRAAALSQAKTLLVTIGEDQHLRLWHKTTYWQGQIDHRFQENPLAVAIHPGGTQLAVGFKETFKVFAVLEDSLLSELDIVVKSCYAVAYSAGGKYLAANNGGAVTLYSPYTLRIIATLAGHSSPVRSLTWNNADALLTTACYAGAVIVWDVSKAEQRSPTIPRQGKVQAAYFDEALDYFALLTNDGNAKLVGDAGTEVDLPAAGYLYTALTLVSSLGLLFLGTSTGRLRVTLWPVIASTDLEKPVIDFQDFQLHSSAILHISISPFYGYLVTTAADGCVLLHNLKLVQAGMRLSPDTAIYQEGNLASSLSQLDISDGLAMNSLALVRANAIERLKGKMKDMEELISTLKSQQKYALESREHKHLDDLELLRKEYEEKIRFEQGYAASLRKDMEQKAVEAASRLQEAENAYQAGLESEVRKHEAVLSEEQDRYTVLKEEMEELRRRIEAEITVLVQTHTSVKTAIEAECRNRLTEAKSAYSKLIELLQIQGERYEAGLTQTEKEYEDELASEKAKLELQLTQAQDYGKNLQLVNTRLSAEKDNLARKDEALLKENQTLKEANAQIKAETEDLKLRLSKMQEQITEREDVIKKKETTVKELRAFNIHLQNFRFVLDQKIKALREDRGPLGEQLMALQDHIRNMYTELLEEFEKGRSAYMEAVEVRARNQALMDWNKELKRRLAFSKRQTALIQSDLVRLTQETSKDTLLLGLRILVEKHLEMDDLVASQPAEQLDGLNSEEANTEKVRAEVLYQHDLMKEQLLAAQRRSKALETKKQSEMYRKMQENAALIQECNALRDNNRALQQEVVRLRDRVSKLKSEFKDRLGKRSDLVPLRTDQRLGAALSELERNRNEIMEQNTQFRRLQEQVSNFLIPDEGGLRRAEVRSPRRLGPLSHSTTLPTLQSSAELEAVRAAVSPKPPPL